MRGEGGRGEEGGERGSEGVRGEGETIECCTLALTTDLRTYPHLQRHLETV